MKIFALAGGVLLAAVLVTLALAIGLQRRFIYPAPPLRATVAVPGFAPVELHTADGLTLTALYRPAQGRRTVIFFHGNGDTLHGSLVATAAYAAAGYGVLLPEYRGYGGNPGHPSESGLNDDAAAALAFLRRRGVADDRIVAIGNSLGSGAATELATREHLAGLVIVSGFTSLPAAAAGMTRLPIAPLIRDRFDNATKLAATRVPVLVLHGDADRVIAVAHGRRLAAAARTRLVEFAGAGHALVYSAAAQQQVLHWLDALGR